MSIARYLIPIARNSPGKSNKRLWVENGANRSSWWSTITNSRWLSINLSIRRRKRWKFCILPQIACPVCWKLQHTYFFNSTKNERCRETHSSFEASQNSHLYLYGIVENSVRGKNATAQGTVLRFWSRDLQSRWTGSKFYTIIKRLYCGLPIYRHIWRVLCFHWKILMFFGLNM